MPLVQDITQGYVRNVLGDPEDIFYSDDEDACSTCSSVYSVGDISLISDDDDDGVHREDEENVEETRVNAVAQISENSENAQVEGVQESQSESSDSICPGFGLIIDNLDLNVRRSDQRIDRTTKSYHFCHAYGLQNRVNSTQLEDQPPSGVLSLDLILPNKTDLDILMEEFGIFAERYIQVYTIALGMTNVVLCFVECLLSMCLSTVVRQRMSSFTFYPVMIKKCQNNL